MANPINLLLAEDDPEDAEVIHRMLSESSSPRFGIEWVQTLQGAVLALPAGRFSVLLLDLGRPGMRDLGALFQIQGLYARVPIVIVTERDDESVALRALQVGAQDYLVKSSMTTASLVHSIHSSIERHRLVQHLAETQTNLKNRNRRLEKMYRTAYEFVDNVSHEFRTPLAVIKEYTALICDGIVGGVSDEQRQLLTVVEDRADDLNMIVDDMLDVSKLEAGLLGVHREKCNAAEIVARVRPALDRRAATKSVQLKWDVAADLASTYCDPDKARRVLINLTVNALKFCGEPGRVRVSCRNGSNAAGIEFSVTDNGQGISPEDQRALFGRFTQLTESFRSSSKGFGLGLSIAKDLVEANLGEIRVESAPGQGSTFSFTLPPADPAEVLRLYLHGIERLASGPRFLSLVRIEIAESVGRDVADDVDGFLSYLLRHNDLALRISPSRWLMVLSIAESGLPAFRKRVDKTLGEARRNRLEGQLPEIDFRILGTWRADCHEGILATLRETAPAETIVVA